MEALGILLGFDFWPSLEIQSTPCTPPPPWLLGGTKYDLTLAVGQDDEVQITHSCLAKPFLI